MTAPGLGSAPQPLRTVTPGLGVNIGLDLANECMVGSPLPVALGGSGQATAVIQQVAVPLTAAQINGMNAAPVQIVPAQGAGISVVVHKALFRFLHGGTQFKSGGAVSLEYDNTAGAGGTLATSTFAAAQILAAADSDNIITGVNAVAAQNKGIFISNDTGAFTTGTGTAVLEAWFSTI